MVEWICDGCGKREPGVPTPDGWRKPNEWFQRNYSVKPDGSEADGIFAPRGPSPQPVTFKTILSACSRDCIGLVAAKNKTHDIVFPI